MENAGGDPRRFPTLESDQSRRRCDHRLNPPNILSIRYTDRLEDAGAVCSVGSRGDSYDNALAEAVNGLYKAEVIRKRGPWRTLEPVELATAEWVDWWNHRRLHSAIGDVPPAEYEANYHHQRAADKAA